MVSLSRYMLPLCFLAVFIIAGCGAIKPYSLTDIVADSQGVNVIMPASETMRSYDAGLASQWDRTFNFCYQIKKALVSEINQREVRLSVTRSWFLGFGGIAGLTSTVYSGIKENPEKEVLVPLSIVSGTALISLLPSFSQDERLETLKQRLDMLRGREQIAVNYYKDLETTLGEIGLSQARIDPGQPEFYEDPNEDQKKAVKQKIRELHSQFETLRGKLRQALVEWSNAAQ